MHHFTLGSIQLIGIINRQLLSLNVKVVNIKLNIPQNMVFSMRVDWDPGKGRGFRNESYRQPVKYNGSNSMNPIIFPHMTQLLFLLLLLSLLLPKISNV